MNTKQRKLIVEKLAEILDPEIGLNIVDVGLLYWIDIDDENKVTIYMTLTTPACPLSEYFLSEVETKLLDLDFIEDVQVEFIWTPQWDITMIDEGAKQKMFGKEL